MRHLARCAGSSGFLLRDHERLDALFIKLLDEFRGGNSNDLRAMWTFFREWPSAHFDAEGGYLLSFFARVDPEEAVALLSEHTVFRRMLD